MIEQQPAKTDIAMYRISAQTIQMIDAYEAANFKSPSKLFERLVKVLPHDGEVYFKFVLANGIDRSISVVYNHDGEDKVKWLPITEPKTLGNLLFLHAITTATIHSATHWALDFSTVYTFAQILAKQITPGDIDTYPKYVDQITPEMMVEGTQLDLYRQTVVGESRAANFIQFQKVLVRYTARLCDENSDTNIREVFPIARCGEHITFNQYLPHTAQILGPTNDKSVLPVVERYALGFTETVTPIEDLAGERILNVATGELSAGQDFAKA